MDVTIFVDRDSMEPDQLFSVGSRHIGQANRAQFLALVLDKSVFTDHFHDHFACTLEGRSMMLATEQQLSPVISKQAGGFLLCQFSHAEDLLFGIDALQSFHIPIHEVYTPVYIEGLKAKLELKKLKTGYAVLKYGCFGGASLSPLLLYALNRDWRVPLINMALTALFLLIAFLCASRLIATKPPRIIKLPATDHRFAIMIEKKHIIVYEGIASFLQYSGAVEISQAVKKMLIK